VSKIQIKRDNLNRIHLIDDYTPYGALIFDVYDDRVIICQDCEDQEIRSLFENINESAEFDKEELILGLLEVIRILERSGNA
jgi:hypothetical protein